MRWRVRLLGVVLLATPAFGQVEMLNEMIDEGATSKFTYQCIDDQKRPMIATKECLRVNDEKSGLLLYDAGCITPTLTPTVPGASPTYTPVTPGPSTWTLYPNANRIIAEASTLETKLVTVTLNGSNGATGQRTFAYRVANDSQSAVACAANCGTPGSWAITPLAGKPTPTAVVP